MGESEWVRLTEEGVDGSSSHYSYRKGSVLWKHGLAWTSTRKQCGPLRRPDQFLTDAELDALAAHAPAVKALVEAARRFCAEVDNEVLEHLYSQYNRPLAEDMLEKRDRLVAALAALGKEEDDARQ